MITRDSKVYGNAEIDNTPMRWTSELTLKGELITIKNDKDNTPMRWTSELTLKGELITIKNDKNKILALVNNNKFFGKVVLLQADCLNYEWAKQQALKVYMVAVETRKTVNHETT